MNREKLENLIKNSLDMLYFKDYYLICNHPQGCKEDRHVSERGIVFRFGLYFYQLLNELNDKYFDELSLDVEYNRNFYDKKTLYSFNDGTFPDMIIHKRNSNDFNFLVLEFKTWWNKDNTRDIQKISGFMDKNQCYCYKYGATIFLDKNLVEIMWINPDGNNESVTYKPNIII